MARIDSSFFNINHLETLSYQDTSIHRLDPRVKLLTTLVFVVTVVSFNKYEITGLIPFMLYPVILIAMGNLPLSYLFKKVLLVAPFAVFVGIFNPFFDREVLVHLGPVGVSQGWISFGSIMLRFLLTVSAALILIACSGFHAVCMAMERMGAPRSFTVQLLFLYRYIFVLVDEASRMIRARALRSFGGRGMGIRVVVNMIGQLLLRTLDRAHRIHSAMLCRGFDGKIRLLRPLKFGRQDGCFLVGWCALFVLMRLVDIPQWLGEAVTGLMR